MKRLLLLGWLALGCGPREAKDPGPLPGSPCRSAELGYGACSPDAGDLLVCTDGGWRVLDDCRVTTPACHENSGALQCGCAAQDRACRLDAGV